VTDRYPTATATTTTAEPTLDAAARPAGRPTVVSTSWPWRGSEKRTIVLTPLAGLAVSVYGQGWWWIVAPLALGAAFWLYRIGRYRKNRSSVTATITHDRISVRSQSLMGDSAVVIDTVHRIGYREFQSDRCVLLLGDGTAARVPERLLDQEPVRAVLARVLAGSPAVSAEARALLTDAGLV
jgi:hypothetical protein